MHVFDVVIAAAAVFFIFTGIKRGLIGEVVRLAAMIIGFIIAFLYFHDFAKAPLLKFLSLQPAIKNALAFLMIYLVCALIIIGIGWVIKKIVHLTVLGWLDRLIGALIGLLKTLLIAYVACLSISSLPIRRIQQDFKHSVVLRMYNSLPDNFELKSLLKKRTYVRTIRKKKTIAEFDTVRNRIEKFRIAVDSAKKIKTSAGKD